MIILNESLEICEIDSIFVQGMMYQSRDKYRCYCNC